MNILNIDRRQFIKIGISSGVLAALPFGCSELDDDDIGELLKFVSDSGLPVNEKRTGMLSQADFDILSTVCSYVNQAWELTSDLGPYVIRLRADLAYKTKEEPSYLTEYEHSVELINLLVSRSDTIEEAWSTLLFQNSWMTILRIRNWAARETLSFLNYHAPDPPVWRIQKFRAEKLQGLFWRIIHLTRQLYERGGII